MYPAEYQPPIAFPGVSIPRWLQLLQRSEEHEYVAEDASPDLHRLRICPATLFLLRLAGDAQPEFFTFMLGERFGEEEGDVEPRGGP